MMGLILAGALGVGALGFVLFNIYQGFFVLKAPSALVVAPLVELRAETSGIFNSQLSTEAVAVDPGQVIGTISQENEPVTTEPGNTAPEGNAVVSDCDCFIAEVNVFNGQHIDAGGKILTLVPSNAKPWIVAEVPVDKAMKLNTSTEATVKIAGNQLPYKGKIVSLKSGVDGTGPGPDGLPRPTLVKILLDQNIPADFTGRPAKVLFSLR